MAELSRAVYADGTHVLGATRSVCQIHKLRLFPAEVQNSIADMVVSYSFDYKILKLIRTNFF